MKAEETKSPEIASKHDYVVYSHLKGMISEHASATEAVTGLVKYAREHPGAKAAIYRRVAGDWQQF